MQLLRIELREIVLRRKGWLLIVCSLIVYGLVIWHDTGNHLVNQYYNDWKDCEVLKQLEGSYNEEKEDIVHNLRINYDKALLQLDSEKEKYQSGLIDVEEYQKNAGEYIRIMKEYLLVRTVEEQYDYVIEDIEHRYFCNYNGWNYFFGRDSLKILYVIVIFLMLIPLFAEESENGIHGLLLSCENGCGKLFFLESSQEWW